MAVPVYVQIYRPPGKDRRIDSFLCRQAFHDPAFKNGRYISFTADLEPLSSEEVIAFYREAGKIEGLIAR